RRWWADQLRSEHYRCLPPRRWLRRADSQRRKAGRPADPTIDEVRAGDQRQHSEGAWTRNFANAARPRRPGDRVRRREFITLLGGAVAWPLAARAQQAGKPPTIGFLGQSTRSATSEWTTAFVQRLRELGWIDGRNVAIEYRWGEGRDERFAQIAAEFVRLK